MIFPHFSLGLHPHNLLTWELAIPQERLEMKEEFLSRLVKLTSLENGRSYILSKKDHGASDGFRGNQYEIEVVSGKDCHLAEPKTEEVIADDFKSNQKYICLPHRELL